MKTTPFTPPPLGGEWNGKEGDPRGTNSATHAPPNDECTELPGGRWHEWRRGSQPHAGTAKIDHGPSVSHPVVEDPVIEFHGGNKYAREQHHPPPETDRATGKEKENGNENGNGTHDEWTPARGGFPPGRHLAQQWKIDHVRRAESRINRGSMTGTSRRSSDKGSSPTQSPQTEIRSEDPGITPLYAW